MEYFSYNNVFIQTVMSGVSGWEEMILGRMQRAAKRRVVSLPRIIESQPETHANDGLYLSHNVSMGTFCLSRQQTIVCKQK